MTQAIHANAIKDNALCLVIDEAAISRPIHATAASSARKANVRTTLSRNRCHGNESVACAHATTNAINVNAPH